MGLDAPRGCEVGKGVLVGEVQAFPARPHGSRRVVAAVAPRPANQKMACWVAVVGAHWLGRRFQLHRCTGSGVDGSRQCGAGAGRCRRHWPRAGQGWQIIFFDLPVAAEFAKFEIL